jgi:hypothetical protein
LRNEVFLASDNALKRLCASVPFPASFNIISHGTVSLRGKSSELAISAIRLK